MGLEDYDAGKARFDLIDTDGDGSLSPDEVEKFVSDNLALKEEIVTVSSRGVKRHVTRTITPRQPTIVDKNENGYRHADLPTRVSLPLPTRLPHRCHL